ncbi:MAG: hypothetical protein ACI4QZ_05990 [Eubacteriales bacterium]
MIFPSIEDLTKGKYNRYELVIATAKCARMITDEYVKERETAEKIIAGTKESEKAVFSMIKREFRDEKAVKCAINRLYSGDFVILSPEEAAVKRAERAEKERREAEVKALEAKAKEKVKFDFSDDAEEDISEDTDESGDSIE